MARQLLGICFWRKGREERNWVEFMGEKGGWFQGSGFKVGCLLKWSWSFGIR